MTRKGLVPAAVTADSKPVPGCDARSLGSLRYVAVCSPSFHEKWMSNGLITEMISAAPALIFGNKDELHARWLSSQLQYDAGHPFHQLPSTTAITNGVLQGLGRVIVPESLAELHVRSGEMIQIAPNHRLDIPLFGSALEQLNRRSSNSIALFMQQQNIISMTVRPSARQIYIWFVV